MAKVTCTIDQLGNIKMDVTGATGKQCDDLTKGIEIALRSDAGVITKEHKPEYNMPSSTDQSVQQTRW